MNMKDLGVSAITAFIPARDYELSRYVVSLVRLDLSGPILLSFYENLSVCPNKSLFTTSNHQKIFYPKE